MARAASAGVDAGASTGAGAAAAPRRLVGGGRGLPVDLGDRNGEQGAVRAGQVRRVAPAHHRLLQRNDGAALEDDHVGQSQARNRDEERDGDGIAPVNAAHCCSFQFCSMVWTLPGVTS